jgi:D-alanyl-D-alanine carboxypeptidase
MVTSDYRPPDLVSVARANIRGGGKVRAFVIDDLHAMAAAARDAGNPIAVTSAFRSHEQQRRLFQGYVERHGVEQARRESARPGHSEHQLGTALDFKSEGGPDPWNLPDWAATEAGSWMELNAWRYGFVMSYPEGASDVTGYMYEPWHYRYVGRTAAAQINRLGVTPREWLYSLGGAEPDA